MPRPYARWGAWLVACFPFPSRRFTSTGPPRPVEVERPTGRTTLTCCATLVVRQGISQVGALRLEVRQDLRIETRPTVSGARSARIAAVEDVRAATCASQLEQLANRPIWFFGCG